MDGYIIIIAALIGALGAIIAAIITAHSNKRNSNNLPLNTNVTLPQQPTQSYPVGRKVSPPSNINVPSSKQSTRSYTSGNFIDEFEYNHPILYGFIKFILIIIGIILLIIYTYAAFIFGSTFVE